MLANFLSAKKNDEKLLIPCTPYGCLLLLRELNINLAGKNAVVIGRSNIVGKPMSQLLLKESCTITTVHSKPVNIAVSYTHLTLPTKRIV